MLQYYRVSTTCCPWYSVSLLIRVWLYDRLFCAGPLARWAFCFSSRPLDRFFSHEKQTADNPSVYAILRNTHRLAHQYQTLPNPTRPSLLILVTPPPPFIDGPLSGVWLPVSRLAANAGSMTPPPRGSNFSFSGQKNDFWYFLFLNWKPVFFFFEGYKCYTQATEKKRLATRFNLKYVLVDWYIYIFFWNQLILAGQLQNLEN